MKPDRRLAAILDPQMLVGLGALLVSVCALGVGIYEASLERHHVRAQVWPHIEVTTSVSTLNGSTIVVLNSGLGPALIKSMQVVIDGAPAESWPTVFDRMLGKRPQSYNLSTIEGRALRSGDQLTMLDLPAHEMPAVDAMMANLAHIGVRICYASVFDEHWQLTVPALVGDSTWTEVRSCPPAVPPRAAF